MDDEQYSAEAQLIMNTKSKYWQQPRFTYATSKGVRQVVHAAKASGRTRAVVNAYETIKLPSATGTDRWAVILDHELSIWDMSGPHPFLLAKRFWGNWEELQDCYIPHRIRQLSGTCYYNSALHALICGKRLPNIIRKAVKQKIGELSAEDKQSVLTKPMFHQAPYQVLCTKIRTWADMLRLLYTMLDDSAPTHIDDYGMSAIANRVNIGRNLVYASAFRNPNMNYEGGEPTEVIKHLLDKLEIPYMYFEPGNHKVVPNAKVFVRAWPHEMYGRSLKFNNTRWRLDSSVMGYTERSHAIVGLWCNGQPYVYDSLENHAKPCNWMSPTSGLKPITYLYVQID